MFSIRKQISIVLLFALVFCSVFTFGAEQANALGTSKLIAYYKFDGDTKDYSGFGNDGTAIGSITYSDAKAGKGAKFDGSSYIEVGDSDQLDLTGGYTISLWYYKNDISPKSEQALVAKMGSSINGDESSYSVADHSNRPYLQYYDENKSFSYFDMSNDVDINTWTHLVASYDGSTARIYINGKLAETNTCSGFIPASSGKLYIGCNHTDGSCFFNGIMDELRIYSGVLTPTEVQKIYDGITTDTPNAPTKPSTDTKADVGIVLTGEVVDGGVKLTYHFTSDKYLNSDIQGFYVYKGTSAGGESTTPLFDFARFVSFTDPNPGKINYYFAKAVYSGSSSSKVVVSNEICVDASLKNSMVLQVASPTIVVNGSSKPIDANGTTPVIVQGRTLVPIRAIIEPMGETASWDGTDRKVTLNVNNTTIELWIDKKEATVNGVKKTLDVPPQIVKSRTMLPLRFLADNLGCQTDWNGITSEVTIRY